jgi:hypothetical protein
MASTALLPLSNATSGDLTARDVYKRNTYARSASTVQSLDYTFSSGTPVNTVTRVSSLSSGAGSFNVFVKSTAGLIDVDENTPMLGVTTALTQCSSTLFKANGAFAIRDVTTTQAGTTLSSQFPTNSAVTDTKWLGTSGQTVYRLDNEGNAQFAGTLTTSEDVVVSQDLSVAGTTTLYGATTVVGDQTTGVAKVLFAATSGSGLVVGPSLASSLGELLYDDDASITSQKAFQSTIPLVFGNSTRRAEAGTLGLVVSQTSNSTVRSVLSETSLTFSDRWRLRYDEGEDDIVVEYYNGTAWVVKSRLST